MRAGRSDRASPLRRCAGALGLLLLLLGGPLATAQDAGSHDHHGMQMGEAGMVMGANPDRLPRDCPAITAEHEFEVRAGTRHAVGIAGAMFTYDQRDFRVSPCSRVTVRFINDDDVRHQWMLHGLPRYLYPGGMFHLEAAGRGKVSGTFIVPSDHATYLVHCDIAQHMEKGMKAQLVAGRGSGDLWAIPGVSAPLRRDEYLPVAAGWLLGLGFSAGWVFAWLLRRRSSASAHGVHDAGIKPA